MLQGAFLIDNFIAPQFNWFTVMSPVTRYNRTGTGSGIVLDKEIGEPIKAKVWRSDNFIKSTTAESRFTFENIPTGYELINVSADGYADGSLAADVYQGDESPEVTIFLTVRLLLGFDGKK